MLLSNLQKLNFQFFWVNELLPTNRGRFSRLKLSGFRLLNKKKQVLRCCVFACAKDHNKQLKLISMKLNIWVPYYMQR